MALPSVTTRFRLGNTDLHVAPIAVGTWAWGERGYWGYERDHGPRDVVDAFAASADLGLDLFDTAEVYGDGESEKILGFLLRKHPGDLFVATKFGLLPGRNAKTLPRALDASLKRLGRAHVDLYQIHWPDRTMATVEALMSELADIVSRGKARAVGVSNFSADETQRAHAALTAKGIPLASNQVRYSLVDRSVEVNGVLDTCRDLGVSLLAYSPLGQGILSGRYTPTTLPSGPRAGHPEFAPARLEEALPLVALLREIGQSHGGRPASQIALAWLVGKGVLPIAGAKTGAQATENAGALGLTLDATEMTALDRASERWR